MDNVKIGLLIYKLRKEKGYTQLQLANHLNVSDKTISKWERGLGCPDISLFSQLAEVFGVDMEKLLSGELAENRFSASNIKKMNFYICPVCKNIVTAVATANISCCGKKMKNEIPQKAADDKKLTVEIIENDWYLTGSHPMTKDHYISFIAFLNGDTAVIRKLYPQWDLQTRIPFFSHGRLVWYCTEHGLFYQEV